MTVHVRTVLGTWHELADRQRDFDRDDMIEKYGLFGALTKIRDYHGDFFPALALQTKTGTIVNFKHVVEMVEGSPS